ncbi:hypothetical protein NECAME_04029 [Necator americanus]|uniref:Phosphorylated adapter RNA export protein n=1 Tax=Necator americanus TaxID=51031 RepID=W2SXJ8_NECAM|nr:hypothetical protein NECAME_04029 [Necator americanus]ETN74350.1 hypothetical protein NECAME_04029 [Necator americanus]
MLPVTILPQRQLPKSWGVGISPRIYGFVQREVPINSSEDPFGDAPVDLSGETAFCERLSEGSWLPRGRSIRNESNRRGQSSSRNNRGRGTGPNGHFHRGQRGSIRSRGRDGGNGLKRPWTGKVTDPAQLLLASYSLETLMAVEFASDISVEQLGDEMAKAMGERDPKTVKSIVQVCGVEKAIALFEETRSVESQGGMMVPFQIDNGQRRRTPGGVFISLFKLDPDIPGDVKKRLFEVTKTEARRVLRARRKGRSDFSHDVAKVAELIKKEKGKDNTEDTLKPLPHVEQTFHPNSSPVAGGSVVLNDLGDAEMES